MISIPKIKTNVTLVLDRDGKIIREVRAHNLVTSGGLAHIADQLAAVPTQTAMTAMAIGTDSTSASATDTALGAEVFRKAFSTHLTGAANGSVEYTAYFSAGQGTGSLREAALISALVTGGTILARVVYDLITKGASDGLSATWTVTFADDGV